MFILTKQNCSTHHLSIWLNINTLVITKFYTKPMLIVMKTYQCLSEQFKTTGWVNSVYSIMGRAALMKKSEIQNAPRFETFWHRSAEFHTWLMWQVAVKTQVPNSLFTVPTEKIKLPLRYVYGVYMKQKRILCLDLVPISKLSHYCICRYSKIRKNLKSKTHVVPSISGRGYWYNIYGTI